MRGFSCVVLSGCLMLAGCGGSSDEPKETAEKVVAKPSPKAPAELAGGRWSETCDGKTGYVAFADGYILTLMGDDVIDQNDAVYAPTDSGWRVGNRDEAEQVVVTDGKIRLEAVEIGGFRIKYPKARWLVRCGGTPVAPVVKGERMLGRSELTKQALWTALNYQDAVATQDILTADRTALDRIEGLDGIISLTSPEVYRIVRTAQGQPAPADPLEPYRKADNAWTKLEAMPAAMQGDFSFLGCTRFGLRYTATETVDRMTGSAEPIKDIRYSGSRVAVRTAKDFMIVYEIRNNGAVTQVAMLGPSGGLAVNGGIPKALPRCSAVRADAVLPSEPSLASAEVTMDDYPKDALAAKEEAAIFYDAIVDTSGAPKSCKIDSPVPHPSFDKLTCEIVMSRFKFRPATDLAGATVDGEYSGHISWRLP